MASSSSSSLHLTLLLLLLLLSSLPSSSSTLHRSKLTTSESLTTTNLLSTSQLQSQSQTPTEFFQVSKPIPTPNLKPCSLLLLQHNFSNTYGKPPVTAPYSPPRCLRRHHQSPPSLAVLEWSATCQGRQFDRIFGVWLAGVEILRSCTAEPRATGIFWKVEKDITKYSSLLSQPQTLAVYMGNLVDSTYTGVYHVNISIHFWFDGDHGSDKAHQVPGFSSPADLILPVSRNLPLNDGIWFEIQNSTDFQSKEVAIPRNAYRAVLEVYVSFHQNDEFWYTNPPNDYVEKNNITGLPANGAFREVVLSLDGTVVGAVWPFTVIYTGGINPLLWRPITGIGSFDLPSYDIEITPFLGKVLDGEKHRFGFGVKDALDVWFIDANLHLWLDSKSSVTVGDLIKYEAPGYAPSLISEFKGLDGKFDTSASRNISSTGWVKSSYGKITTHFFQTLNYNNLMEFKGNGSIQVVNQTINFNSGAYAKHPSAVLYSEEVFQSFPLYLYTGTSDQVNDSYSSVSNVSLGFNKKKLSGERFGFSFSSLTDSQKGQGVMKIKGNLVTSGIGSTQQVFRYESTDGCYFRNVSSSNYTILHDESGDACSKGLGSFFAK